MDYDVAVAGLLVAAYCVLGTLSLITVVVMAIEVAAGEW